MLWVWITLPLALVAVIGCMAWLRSVKRARSQGHGRVPSPAPDEGYGAEVERTASDPAAPPVDESKRAGSQFPVVSETEPTAPQQHQDASESPGTQEDGGPLTAEEVPTEQPGGGDQETVEGSTTVLLEKAHSLVGEAPSTSGEKSNMAESQSEGLDTPPTGGVAVAVEEGPRVDDEPEFETAKKAVPPPLETLEPGPPPSHLGGEKEHVTSRPPHDGSPTQAPNEARPEALPGTRHDGDDGEQGDATRKTTKEGRTQAPSEAVVPKQTPLAHDVSVATAERSSNELPDQTSPPSPSTQKKGRRQGPKPNPRKRDTRKRPDLKQVEDTAEDARLLTEEPEIPESAASQPPRPSRYRPPSQEPLMVRQSSGARQTDRQAGPQNFLLTVRLLFRRSGHFSLGLLPQRGTDLPEEIVIGAEGNRQSVSAVHDDWYEDIYPKDLASLLVNGIAWEGRTESEVLGYWRLSGRDLYVLATHDDLRGFVQTTRLKIGRVHVILCRNALLAQVIPVLQQADCTGFDVLEEGLGAPPGWTVIRAVVPKQIGRVEGGPAILTILQPEPALEIELKGGIYLQQGTWLHSFPPRICVPGEMQPGVEVFIDGKGAIADDDGSFSIEGYDTVGEHIVSIPVANTSRTYKITEGDQDWTPWDAHGLSRGSLCGPLLRAADASVTLRAVIVPSSNSVILGPTPGDIAYCPRIPGPKQVGCVSFDAVWALPYDAFGCRKATTTIRLLSALRLDRKQRRHFTGKEASSVLAWCNVILNASRKGLSVDTTDPHSPVLWREYKAHARALWKKLKK